MYSLYHITQTCLGEAIHFHISVFFVQSRKCLSLVEALLKLADSGHYAHVQELFKAPVAKCPDVLVLALLQSSVSLLSFVIWFYSLLLDIATVGHYLDTWT